MAVREGVYESDGRFTVEKQPPQLKGLASTVATVLKKGG
jgi:hypothetical protein